MELSVNQAQAYTYRRARVTARCVDRRDFRQTRRASGWYGCLRITVQRFPTALLTPRKNLLCDSQPSSGEVVPRVKPLDSIWVARRGQAEANTSRRVATPTTSRRSIYSYVHNPSPEGWSPTRANLLIPGAERGLSASVAAESAGPMAAAVEPRRSLDDLRALLASRRAHV